MQLTKFQKLRNIIFEGKNLSVADMLCRPFTKKELQMNQIKKQSPLQFHIATLT